MIHVALHATVTVTLVAILSQHSFIKLFSSRECCKLSLYPLDGSRNRGFLQVNHIHDQATHIHSHVAGIGHSK